MLSDNPEAAGLQIAADFGVKTFAFARGQYQSRKEFKWALLNRVRLLSPALVVLAGFMQIVEAEFTDGSGTVTLIWMGRRSIPGITAGRELIVSGRVSFVDGERRVYNPLYELVPA